jgi:hypothetical protein
VNAAVGFLLGLIVAAIALSIPIGTELTAIGHWVMTWVGG